MHKIGILSDTHGLLRQEVLEACQGCELILHGGDINKQSILDELEKIAPVYVVRGNNDKEWAQGIPENLELEFFGKKFYMVHNKKFIPRDVSAYDFVIYGHSHKYEEKLTDQTFFLNPGSCGPRRFNQPITMAILYVEEQDFRVEKVDISHPKSGSNVENNVGIPTNIGEMLPGMMTDMQSGKSVKQIAGKYKISIELSEQICRMYFTHPGIDVDGILRRIGL